MTFEAAFYLGSQNITRVNMYIVTTAICIAIQQQRRLVDMRNSIQFSDSKPIVIAGRFAELDQLTQVAAAWDVDFRQVGKGKLNATLAQATGESWSLAMACFDRPTFQRGTTVAGMRTFAILDSHASEQEWCGRIFSPDTIAVFAGDGAFQAISQPGFDVHTLSFSDEKLASACERLGVPDVTEKLLSRATVLQIDRRQTRELRHLVKSALQALCEKGLEYSDWDGGEHIGDKISEHLVLLLTDSSYLSYTPSQRLRSRAIHSAFEVIEAGLANGISVREVIKATGVSRRTLEYAFRNRYNFSPKEFINSQRMVMVRRELLSQPGTVTEIASQWGYWHMGQFARDYQRQFGELPSQTRVR